MAAYRLVVLISGNGSNLQAIIDAIAAKQIQASIVAVISDQADAFGLTRASQAGIHSAVLSAKSYPNREAYDADLQKQIDAFEPDLVVLSGFMRILSDDIVQHFHGKMINIHPSLLPKYRGLHTHRKVLDAGDKEHGCSIHFVSDELDGGPLIAQATLPVLADDDESSLKARVQQLEHQLFPQVIAQFADKKIELSPQGVLIEGKASKYHNPTCEMK